MPTLTFSHVAIACKDPLATERFYSKYFGFKRARVIPLGTDQIVFIKSGDTYLELFRAKEQAPIPPAGQDGPWYPGWRHIAFQVDNVDAKLAEMGEDARITLGPGVGVCLFLISRRLNGHIIVHLRANDITRMQVDQP